MTFCPRCPEAELLPRHGVLHEDVCPGCHGRFLDDAAASRVLTEELGLEKATLRELAALFGGLTLTCPGCQQRTRPVTIRGVPVDLCFGCGGLWCDAGELEQLSGGRHREVLAEPPVVDEAASGGLGVGPILTEVAPRGVASSGGGGRLMPGGAAVFVTHSDPLDADQLWTALESFAQYSRPDMPTLARRSMGIVLEGAARSDAEVVADRLTRAGEEALVDDTRWCQPPPPHQPRRMEVHPHGMVFIDMHDRRHALRWPEIQVVNAGLITSLTRPANKVSTVLEARQMHQPVNYGGRGHHVPATASSIYNALRSSAPVEKQTMVLDVIGPEGRLQVVDGSAVSFHDGATPGPKRLKMAIERLLEGLSSVGADAVLGKGIRTFVKEGRFERYGDTKLFEREMAWAAWRATTKPS